MTRSHGVECLAAGTMILTEGDGVGGAYSLHGGTLLYSHNDHDRERPLAPILELERPIGDEVVSRPGWKRRAPWARIRATLPIAAPGRRVLPNERSRKRRHRRLDDAVVCQCMQIARRTLINAMEGGCRTADALSMRTGPERCAGAVCPGSAN